MFGGSKKVREGNIVLILLTSSLFTIDTQIGQILRMVCEKCGLADQRKNMRKTMSHAIYQMPFLQGIPYEMTNVCSRIFDRIQANPSSEPMEELFSELTLRVACVCNAVFQCVYTSAIIIPVMCYANIQMVVNRAGTPDFFEELLMTNVVALTMLGMPPLVAFTSIVSPHYVFSEMKLERFHFVATFGLFLETLPDLGELLDRIQPDFFTSLAELASVNIRNLQVPRWRDAVLSHVVEDMHNWSNSSIRDKMNWFDVTTPEFWILVGRSLFSAIA